MATVTVAAGLLAASVGPAGAGKPAPCRTLPESSQGTDLYIEQGKFHGQFAADVPKVLVATEDLNIPPQAQTFMAERAKAHTVQVRASHAVSVSRPDDVADLIERAARTVR
ncbi:hypothetical protein [Streptomyces sp. NPDC020951]|uniref:hypothetical protein n=1 Tax=Streptomyces sp. NPDC020951 TaxID=3365104 RepID=UPI003790F5D2